MIAGAALALFLALSGAPEVGVEELLADPASFDGATAGEITVIGELVGDFQRRGAWVWVQLNDDAYVSRPLREYGPAGGNIAIGVRIPADLFAESQLAVPGGYRFRGPVVRITGSWRYHDDSLGGESYLDASSVAVVEPARRLDEPMSIGVLATGLVLVAVGVTVPVMRRRRRAVGR